MKNIPVVVLTLIGFAAGGLAEAQSPQKRTRSQNRVGPYATGLVGMSMYTGDHADNEQFVSDILTDNSVANQNLEVSTDDSDIAYQVAFGYRFTRYVAAEFSLGQFGDLISRASADLDFGDGEGFVPTTSKLTFNGGGFGFSLLGILPFNNQFEGFARAGYLFANVDGEFVARVEGEVAANGSAQDDTQIPYFGVGVGWNINQVFTVRAEYQMFRDVGDDVGGEDIDFLALGLSMRF